MESGFSVPCIARQRTRCRASSTKSTLTWVRAVVHYLVAEVERSDTGWFSRVIGYGITYGGLDVLTQVEISYILVAALISMDTPRQIVWHLANAQHGGATLEEVKAIRRISMEVAERSGIKWKDSVPEISE